MQRVKKSEIITLRVTPQTKDRIQAKARELAENFAKREVK